MKRILKDALVLFCITLIAGLALATVYAVTKEPITAAELSARAEAYRTVFADAADFVADDAVDTAVSNSAQICQAAGFDSVTVSDALFAVDADGNPIGCVLTVNGKGYGGTIQLTMGVRADHTISGVSILSHSETAGLGAKCTDEAFIGQYTGKPADTLTVVKTGAKESNEIDAISGATITTNGITEAVNAGLQFVKTNMQTGGPTK